MTFTSTTQPGFPYDRIYGGHDFITYPDGQTTDMGVPALRLLILGNSITYSPIQWPSYWWGMCGKAATAPENDYAHRLALRVANRLQRAVSVKLAACWLWERDFATFDYALLAEYRDFAPDVFVYRMGDNIADNHPNISTLGLAIGTLVDAMAAAHAIITGPFYQRPAVHAIAQALATARNLPFAPFLDLFADDANRATTHRDPGTAQHPSDLAHAEFARRVFIAGEQGGLW